MEQTSFKDRIAEIKVTEELMPVNILLPILRKLSVNPHIAQDVMERASSLLCAVELLSDEKCAADEMLFRIVLLDTAWSRPLLAFESKQYPRIKARLELSLDATHRISGVERFYLDVPKLPD